MNSITRTAVRMIIATPLALGAVGVGAGIAQADNPPAPGPGLVIVNPIPEPEPEPQPVPEGPGDIKAPGHVDPEPHPQPNPVPDGPGEITNGGGHGDPEPEPGPLDGPDDFTDGDGGDEPRPDDFTNGDGGDGGEDTPEETPADEGDTPEKPSDDLDVANGGPLTPIDYDVPNRIDAGEGSADGSMELAWVLAGGGVVTAAGAFAARRRLARR